MSEDLPGATGTGPQQDPFNLVWADVETTGLTDDAALLEVAFVVTDSNLEVLGTPVSVVLSPGPQALDGMSEVVRDMHTVSGLLAEVGAATAKIHDAQEMILDYLRAWVPPGSSPLCGSTIFFDRKILTHRLPKVNDYLHYRHIDVSTLKELSRRWRPQVYELAAARQGPAMATAGAKHRALPDILDSIAELRVYREHLFAPMPVAACVMV